MAIINRANSHWSLNDFLIRVRASRRNKKIEFPFKRKGTDFSKKKSQMMLLTLEARGLEFYKIIKHKFYSPPKPRNSSKDDVSAIHVQRGGGGGL